ncbi:hypothetical protein GLOTRDRAFT_56136 [Gloeophyllum trabeum ATCC 11539]|uniref:BTB domain-containing protein n=1 Tax=Gloeophyllum trabeum (strain ATCC 11539 / FP-39264 / Madison 617) TaxID=670483 RepID=S7QE63_GLOTA|nr:uncharacterized protein GLOTRDRAFT_56136 [Gloeophyllum trabeum ATCC 11539]EPQ57702.1 hypothetical protein GLOTRDRAFT_56136 [Gloeophyllum trabeum ATCC 11539]
MSVVNGDIATSSGYTTTSLKRHPTYWLEDGSLVVRIQDTGFKVHRTLLQRNSPFIASGTWNSEENNRPASEEVEGCAVFSIPIDRGVSSDDFQTLLEHLYHDAPLDTDAPFARTAAVLRVASSKQLDFPSIYSIARKRFEELYPSGPQPFVHPDNIEEALELAVEHNIESVQRGLFYSIVTTSELHDEEEAGMGEAVTAAAPANESVPLDSRPLSPANKERAKKLMNSIMEHFTPILFTVETAEHMPCTDTFADKWMPLVIGPALENGGVGKPLETLQNIIDVDWEAEGLCAECAALKRQEWREQQEDIWAKIGVWLAETR